MNQLPYEHTLNIVDKFMIDSGIRDFCTNTCGSKCCTGCKDNNPLRCTEMEGRRLSCTIYLCHPLAMLIFTRQEFQTFYKIQEVILKIVGKHINLFEHSMPKNKWPSAIYSLPPGKKLYEEMFPLCITSLNSLDCDKINKKINLPIFPILFKIKSKT